MYVILAGHKVIHGAFDSVVEETAMNPLHELLGRI